MKKLTNTLINRYQFSPKTAKLVDQIRLEMLKEGKIEGQVYVKPKSKKD